MLSNDKNRKHDDATADRTTEVGFPDWFIEWQKSNPIPPTTFSLADHDRDMAAARQCRDAAIRNRVAIRAATSERRWGEWSAKFDAERQNYVEDMDSGHARTPEQTLAAAAGLLEWIARYGGELSYAKLCEAHQELVERIVRPALKAFVDASPGKRHKSFDLAFLASMHRVLASYQRNRSYRAIEETKHLYVGETSSDPNGGRLPDHVVRELFDQTGLAMTGRQPRMIETTTKHQHTPAEIASHRLAVAYIRAADNDGALVDGCHYKILHSSAAAKKHIEDLFGVTRVTVANWLGKYEPELPWVQQMANEYFVEAVKEAGKRSKALSRRNNKQVAIPKTTSTRPGNANLRQGRKTKV